VAWLIGPYVDAWLKEWRNVMLNNEKGKIGWILLWALGIPIPILVLLYLLRGCTWETARQRVSVKDQGGIEICQRG